MAPDPTDPTGLISVSLFRNVEDNAPHGISLSWEDLCDALSTFRKSDEKDGPLWSPAHFSPAHRLLANVQAVSCLVFDLDGHERPEIEELAHVLHTTHSGKWRLVIRQSRPTTSAEHSALWAWVERELALTEFKVDPACKDASRFFYLPSHPLAPIFEPECYVLEGESLDVDRILAAAPRTSAPSPRPAAPIPPAIREKVNEKFDLDAYRESTIRIKDAAKRTMLRELLDGRLLPATETGGRDVTLHHAFSLLATCGDVAPPEDVALALLEPLLQRMECAPEGEVYWREKAMYSFHRALERREATDARDRATARAFARLAGKTEGVAPSDEWRQRLLLKRDKNGEPCGFENRGANVELILSNDPSFHGLCFNVLNKSIEVRGGPLAACSVQTLDVELSNWLARSDYAMNVSRADCAAQLLHAALKNPVDPVADYLQGLKWDGRPRINKALAHYGGAMGNSAYIDGISRKFFVSAVARVLEPGCKVDTMLILHGEQGLGKTKFVEILGSPWAATLKLDISNKDSILVATGSWLVELAELVSLHRSDIESMKAFLSTRNDVIRLPYAKTVESFPRRSVFIGTTNDDTPLTDPTGNRRFWPVTFTELREEELVRDRDQLWAEAVEAFYAGEEWYFKLETDLKMVEREQGAYEEEDTMGEIILGWYLKKAPPRPERVTTQEIMRYAFSLMPDQMNNKTARRIGDSMRRLGCLKRRLRGADRLAWGFEFPVRYRNAQLVEAT